MGVNVPMLMPTEQEILEELGIDAEPLDEWGALRLILLNESAGERLELFLDPSEQTVVYRWWIGESQVADVTRDAVTLVRIVGPTRTGFEVRYGVRDYDGVLSIETHPRVVVRDCILRGGMG